MLWTLFIVTTILSVLGGIQSGVKAVSVTGIILAGLSLLVATIVALTHSGVIR